MELAVARTVSPLLRRHGPVLVLMLGLGLFAALAEGIGLSLFIPLFHNLDPGADGGASGTIVARALDGLLPGMTPADRLPVLAGLILGLVLIKNALVYINALLYSWVYARVGHELRTAIVAQWLDSPIDLLERRLGGSLIDTLKTQTWETIGALLNLVTLAIHAGTFLIFFGLLVLISWKLTLIVALGLAVMAGAAHLIMRRVKRLSEEGVKAHESLSQHMMELVRGMRTVRLFNREDEERARFAGLSKSLAGVHMKRDIRAHLIGPLAETFIAVLLIAILLLAAGILADVATVLTFIFVLYRMYPFLKQVAELRFAVREAHAPVRATMAAASLGDHLAKVLDREPAPPLRRDITLKGVSFRYDGALADSLDEITTTIPARKTTALVGPSGAGKSTLIHLLVKLFEPHEGEITIDGKRLDFLDTRSWRQRVAVVSQDVYLFNTTIRENIAYGRPDVTMREIDQAATRAHAHDFIQKLPDGYDTLVGDGGARLSGGQRQRIALARAFVRKPDIYVLDEATNALDGLSERAIHDAIERLSGEHTVLVIAHRLSTIRNADHIIVMENGRVTEQGDFDALMRRDGLFREMFDAQHGETMLTAV